MKFIYPVGATPLDLDEINQLIPKHINIQSELNEWEQANILEAELWAHKKSLNVSQILSTQFLQNIHRKMFDKTWRWAGKFRNSNKNIGISWEMIPNNLKMFLDDTEYQLSNKIYCTDEIAARFHHRLVSIHPFVNGNGRHARLMVDVLLIVLGEKRFSWGGNDLFSQNPIREKYIEALRAADKQNYQLLFDFIRS